MPKKFETPEVRLNAENSTIALNKIECNTSTASSETTSFFSKMYQVANEIKLEYPFVDYIVSKLMLTVSQYTSVEEMGLLNKEQFLKKNILVNSRTYHLFVNKLYSKGLLR